MSNYALMIAASLGFFALPIIICLARAFGPRWFNAWVALLVDVAAGTWLYAAAAHFAYQMKMNDLGARDAGNSQLYGEVEPYYVYASFLVNLAGALVYYAPFALIYYAWEHRAGQPKREK